MTSLSRKLNAYDVAEIRRAFDNAKSARRKFPYEKMAAEYGVSKGAIWGVVTGRTYQGIPPASPPTPYL